MKRPPRILVVGSTMMDLITYVERVPAAGETLAGGPFELGFGGKGANQAVAARLLGADVAFVNRVGDDVFGEQTSRHLRELDVDVSGVRPTPGAATGAATILVEPSGANRIVVAPGANDSLKTEDVDAAFDALWMPDVVLCQLEVPQAAVIRAFERGRAVGARTILTPAPAAPLDPRLPPLTDWLVPNESELALLHDTLESASRSSAAGADLAATLAAAWDVGVVETLGPDGVRLTVPQQDVPARHVSAPTVDVVDTVGAGDAFTAAFAVGIATDMEFATLLDLACQWASDAVTRRGTQRAYLGSELAGRIGQALGAGQPS